MIAQDDRPSYEEIRYKIEYDGALEITRRVLKESEMSFALMRAMRMRKVEGYCF